MFFLRNHKLFSAFGIPVKVHGTLVLYMALAAFVFSVGSGVWGFLSTLLLFALIFSFVLLHELGHSVVALHYGIPVRQIMLFPLGGIAGIERIPREPKVEFNITLAGPLVNFMLAGVFWIIGLVVPLAFFDVLMVVNLGLGLLNLLPGFPMDGGRILRSILARRMSFLRATQIAVRVGQVTAVAMGVFGLLTLNFILVAIAFFIYFAARAELNQITYEESVRQRPIDPLGIFEALDRARMSQTGSPRVFTWVGRASDDHPSREERSRTIEVLPDGRFRDV